MAPPTEMIAQALVVAAMLHAGCKTDLSRFECDGNVACDLMPGGQCLPTPDGVNSCAYPGDCPGGLVWRDDGALDGQCVSGSAVDASPDVADAGQPDASPAQPDADTGQPGQDMVLVPEGAFMMGCNPAVEDTGYCSTAGAADQLPYHQITLRAFHIDRFELSKAKYKLCVDAGTCASVPNLSVSPNQPVEVRWSEARTYCEWRGARLPTEAEWEKAARGTDGRRFAWGNDAATCALANVADCMLGLVDVDTYRSSASPYGAVSMNGNVWEWVFDGYRADYYSMSPPANPEGPGHGGNILRSKRGGDRLTSSPRVSLRGSGDVTSSDKAGVRCAF